jgi:hypothetical protein
VRQGSRDFLSIRTYCSRSGLWTALLVASIFTPGYRAHLHYADPEYIDVTQCRHRDNSLLVSENVVISIKLELALSPSQR